MKMPNSGKIDLSYTIETIKNNDESISFNLKFDDDPIKLTRYNMLKYMEDTYVSFIVSLS